MAFSPFARFRNFTLDNLKSLLEMYPEAFDSMDWDEMGNIIESRYKGYKKTILEMKEKALQDLGPLRQITAQFAMAQMPITIETSTTVERIEDHVVVASGKEYPYDSVIMAVGSKANDTSMYANLDIPTYIVGDCKKAGVALDAFKDAYHAVLEINK